MAALVEIAKERERLELQAREAEALRRADAVKSSVIQSVSHDLRTPLATIEAALDGLQSPLIGLGEAEQSELLDSVRLALERLKRFVENMLDLSRLQAGAAVPAQTLWTVDALTEQALDELRDGDGASASRCRPICRLSADRRGAGAAGARERARERAQVLATGYGGRAAR